eukprot:1137222-Pelagomonas_calceolata.AAC.20
MGLLCHVLYLHHASKRWARIHELNLPLLLCLGHTGKRYARTDELGVPYAVTVDYEVVSNSTVTVRERDTMTQVP